MKKSFFCTAIAKGINNSGAFPARCYQDMPPPPSPGIHKHNCLPHLQKILRRYMAVGNL